MGEPEATFAGKSGIPKERGIGMLGLELLCRRGRRKESPLLDGLGAEFRKDPLPQISS